jgi:hypothetical protein
MPPSPPGDRGEGTKSPSGGRSNFAHVWHRKRMNDYPQTDRFESATVVLPVTNETAALETTVDVILRDVKPDVKELLIVVGERTTPEAMEVVERLRDRLGPLVVVHRQTLPFLGGAFREAFELARGSHVLMMASDLETDPGVVRQMIDEARRHPGAIVTASRWMPGGRISGYNQVKLVCNWLFQRFLSILYATRLSDMTYGYRLFPTKLVQAIRWEELRHAFQLETILKPLRLGVPVVEIPAAWKCRSEGRSQNTFAGNLLYIRTALKTLAASKRAILKGER